jgi:hypothetical protein
LSVKCQLQEKGFLDISHPRIPPVSRHVVATLPLATTAGRKSRGNIQQHSWRDRRGSHRGFETEVQNPTGLELIWGLRFDV